MSSRPSWDETFFDVAKVVAKRATCPKLQNGVVITTFGHQVISTGYNGAPTGLPHCLEEGCKIEGGHCVRAVHAEMNAILQAARRGISVDGATMYTIYRPCIRCSIAIVQSGIVTVKYLNDYESDGSRSEVEDWLKLTNVYLWKLRY